MVDSCFRMVARGVGAEESAMALGVAGDEDMVEGFSLFHDCGTSLFAMNLKKKLIVSL